jgi:hypothetical protein
MGRLRKKRIIPEDTNIVATLDDGKLVHGQFGRQIEGIVNVLQGEDDEGNSYKGASFKTWFSFAKDKETQEEFVSYGSPLHQLLAIVRPDVDDVLDDEGLSNADYEKFLKKAARDVDDLKIMARVGVKQNGKNNYLQPGTFGPYVDPNAEIDEESEKLDMKKGGKKNGKTSDETIKTPIDDV